MKRSPSILAVIFLLAIGCDKGAQKQASAPPPPPPPEEVVKKPADEQPAQQPKELDPRNSNYRPPRTELGNARNAARRRAAESDLRQMGLLIDALYLETNRMPNAEQIKADLKKNLDARKLYEMIEDGSLILTGNSDHSGLWAYEVDAERLGGLILVGGVPERDTAGDVLRHLEKVKK